MALQLELQALLMIQNLAKMISEDVINQRVMVSTMTTRRSKLVQSIGGCFRTYNTHVSYTMYCVGYSVLIESWRSTIKFMLQMNQIVVGVWAEFTC